MNFDHINILSDYFRNKILPFLRSQISILNFGAYLDKISECSSCQWLRTETRAFPINYFVDPEEFIQKYQKKCIAYVGVNSPNEGVCHIIYQISPDLHVLAKLFNWVENEKVVAYLGLICVYRHHEDLIQFFDDNKNLRLSGNTEEKTVGFRPNVGRDEPKNFMEHLAALAKEP